MNPHYMRAPKDRWTGKLVWALLRLAWTAAVASVRTVWGRINKRPIHPAWSILVEVIVRTLRASVADGLGSLEVARLVPPSALPRSLKDRLTHGHGTLAGRGFESFTPKGWVEGGKTCLYMHGGGYVTCSPATHRLLVAQIAAETSMRCISFDYRLAPEHPCPAAIEDTDAALDELLAGGVDAANLWIGGDSAGGGLSVATMVRRRDRGVVLPAGALLLSPWVDLAGTGASVQDNDQYDYLPAKLLNVFAEYYRGDLGTELPEVSPLHADLTGLPPLLILTGGVELFLSENRDLAARAEAAGVQTEHVVGDAMVHVYPAVLPFAPESKAAFVSMNKFIASIGVP